MYYSNNYSKYIEQLKAEKNKIAFRKLVESTQEDKTQKIYIEEQFSEKSNNLIKPQELPTNYRNGQTIYSEERQDSIKSSKKLSDNSPYINQDEYSGIATDNEVISSEKNSKNLDIENEFSAQEINKTVSRIESFSEKNETDVIKQETTSSKEDNEILYEYSISEKYNNNLKFEEPTSIKSIKNVNNVNNYYGKDEKSIISSIKEEKKAGKSLLNEINENSKRHVNTGYFIARPKKSEIVYAGVRTASFEISPRKIEEDEYAGYANDEYKYYPAGSYSQGASVQRGAFVNAVNTIINPSNWSTPGKVIVNSLKIATDIVDMISISGPSANNYHYLMPNDLRKDLQLKDKYQKFSESEIDKGKDSPSDNGENAASIFTGDKGENSPSDNGENAADLFIGNKGENSPSDNEENAASIFTGDKGKDSPSDNGENAANFNFENSGKTNSPSDNGENAADLFIGNKGKDSPSDNGENAAEINFYNSGKQDYKLFEGEEVNSISPKFKYSTNATPERNAADITSSRWFDEQNSLGKIYVIPPYHELSGTSLVNNNGSQNVNVAFTIPLQNNLMFEQTSRGATWTAIQFFGRIGDVQQYARTNSMDAITLSTKYFVDGYYTMRDIQDIEMKYRSLVLPIQATSLYLDDDDSKNNEFNYFTRPPIINIALGQSKTDNEGKDLYSPNDLVLGQPYNNLFTDIFSTYDSNVGTKNKIYYKNFVVTSVNIDKNLNDYNYYVTAKKNEDDTINGNYLDTMGFTVSLTVLEIDENYLGSIPSFNNYYNTIMQSPAVEHRHSQAIPGGTSNRTPRGFSQNYITT